MADLTLLNEAERHPGWRLHPTELKRLFRAPWLWPADAGEAERVAARIGHEMPSARAPGHVLLVSWVAGLRTGACLHELGPSLTSDGTTMGNGARHAFEAARLVGARSAPFIASSAALDARARWDVQFLVRDDHVAKPHVLDGTSFGLPMVLAVVAQSAGVPVPTYVAATGTVSGDGSVGPVNGLAEKATMIDRFARGVTRLLVPRGQGDEARSAVHRENLAVVEVSTADEALRVVFPDLQEALVQRWADDPETAARVATALYRMALDGQPSLLGWNGVAATTTALLRVLPQGHEARVHASIAGSIGRRHEGLEAPLSLTDAELARERVRTRRTQLLAHLVQSAADHDDRLALVEADRALRWMPASEHRTPDDLRVLGAVGRAYAHAGEHAKACDALELAVQGWFDEGQPDQASHAICAWALTLGQAGDTDGLDALERTPWRTAHEDGRTPSVSRAFLCAALGRAWIQAGQQARSLDYLQGRLVDWSLVPAHLQRGRLRWLAAALQALGLDAVDLRQELTLRHADSPQRLLSEIDSALLGDPDEATVTSLEQAVLAHDRLRREHLRYAPRATADVARERLRALASWFPY